MAKVTGIGGIFFKANDPVALREWYRDHLGIDVQSWGGAAFDWNSPDEAGREGTTAWNISPASTTYFSNPFMINYRVADLDGLISALREEGCNVDENVQDTEYGKFGWVTDPEGNRVELWEPPVAKQAE